MKIGLSVIHRLHANFPRHPSHVLPRRRFISSIEDNASPARIATQLRQYQEECIQVVLSHLNKGHKRLGISLATGSGKTVIFTHLIERVKALNEDAGQTLILVHRRELAEQAAKHCINTYPNSVVEIEMGNMHASGRADITIASVASLDSGDRLEKFDPDRFKLVLVDEAHHIVARSWMNVLNHFGLLKPTTSTPALVGVSATLSRFDGIGLGAALDHIVYHKDFVDMIGEKWLSDVIFTNVQSSADLSKVKRAASGDFNTVDLSRAVNQDVINELTVKSWQAKAGGRKSTMVFCVDIDHLQALAETFRKYGIQTKCVTGTTKPNERSQIVDDFRAGRFPVLLNCSVFTEGTDIPNIDCILLARPTRSRNLLVQMIGRGMRLFPGKKDCHVIDMASSLVAGIVTVPTLFGLHPGVLLENANAKDLKNRQVLPEVLCADDMVTPDALKGKLPKTVTFTDYDSIFDLISDRSTERHIRSLSKLAWVQVNSKRHILTNQDGSYISITCDTTSGNEDVSPNISEAPKEGLSEQPLYAIHYFRKTQGFPSDAAKKWRPIARAVEVGTASTLEDAVHAADTFAKETFPWAMMQSRASWRSADATEGQLKFLNKVRNIDSISGKTMTKGQAADMITKIKFGAQGRFEKMKSLQRQEEKEVEKEEKMRRKVEVKVGPVEK